MSKDDLTAEQIKFVSLVAKGFSGVQAYRQAFPTAKNLSNGYIRIKASELLTNPNIQTEVATTKEKQARLARLAEERIEEILTEVDVESKHGKVPEVAMFMYEQSNGKATQKIQHQGVFVSVSYDLTGGNSTDVPQEVLDQLKEEK